MYDYSALPKRKKNRTLPEDMINVNKKYLQDMCDGAHFDLTEASLAMGYNKVYLYTAIYDGRMNKEHLEALSKILNFSYNNALAS